MFIKIRYVDKKIYTKNYVPEQKILAINKKEG